MSQFYYLNDEILGSCHLAVGERNTVLFDPGMAWYGEKTVEKIKEIIGDRPIDAVFLTHSHYDHVGALPVIKKYWPDAMVFGAAYAGRVFSKLSAKRLIRELSASAAQLNGTALPDDYSTRAIQLDQMLIGGAPIADRPTVKILSTSHSTGGSSILSSSAAVTACIGWNSRFTGRALPLSHTTAACCFSCCSILASSAAASSFDKEAQYSGSVLSGSTFSPPHFSIASQAVPHTRRPPLELFSPASPHNPPQLQRKACGPCCCQVLPISAGIFQRCQAMSVHSHRFSERTLLSVA